MIATGCMRVPITTAPIAASRNNPSRPAQRFMAFLRGRASQTSLSNLRARSRAPAWPKLFANHSTILIESDEDHIAAIVTVESPRDNARRLRLARVNFPAGFGRAPRWRASERGGNTFLSHASVIRW
jgi:hypothetical protein